MTNTVYLIAFRTCLFATSLAKNSAICEAATGLTTSYDGTACPGNQMFTCEGMGTRRFIRWTLSCDGCNPINIGPDPASGSITVPFSIEGEVALLTLSYDTTNFTTTLTLSVDSPRNLDGVNISCSSNNQLVGELTIQLAGMLKL